MKTQICIVTEQALANLIGILHFKPEKMFIVVTDYMKENNNVEKFKFTLSALGLDKNIDWLYGCPNTNLNAINTFFMEKLKDKLPEEPCIFNLTGGTKMHSFSMYEAFKDRNDGDQFIYIDTQNRLLEYYPKKSGKPSSEPLPIVLDAEKTLIGMGKQKLKASSDQSNWRDKALARRELTFWIANNIQRVSGLLKALNGIVAKIYPQQEKTIPQNQVEYLNYMPKGKKWELLNKANQEGVIIWDGRKEIYFDSYEQARYLTGDWIEEYVWLIAKDMGFEEVYCSLKFGNEANNEIDLFIQHQNIALAIECKSASSAYKEVDNICNKLNTVANRAGGLMCGKLLVSAFSLTDEKGNVLPSVYRAKEQKISVIQMEEIVSNLPKILNKWKDSGRL